MPHLHVKTGVAMDGEGREEWETHQTLTHRCWDANSRARARSLSGSVIYLIVNELRSLSLCLSVCLSLSLSLLSTKG